MKHTDSIQLVGKILAAAIFGAISAAILLAVSPAPSTEPFITRSLPLWHGIAVRPTDAIQQAITPAFTKSALPGKAA